MLFTMRKVLILLSIMGFFACQSTNHSEKMEVYKDSEKISKSDHLILHKIIHEFNDNIVSTKSKRPVYENCQFHAKTVIADFLNELPANLNYPYRKQDDLSQIEEMLLELSFISDKCGFQSAEKSIQFPCLSNEGTYMELLETDDAVLLNDFAKSYKKFKSITPKMRGNFLMHAASELDFKKIEHLSFYVIYHYCTALEKRASDDLQAN